MLVERKPNGQPWYVGELVRIDGALSNVFKAKVDPTTVTVSVYDPQNTTGIPSSTPAVVKDGTGEDHANVELTKPGTWRIVMTTTGAYQGVETIEIPVKKAPGP